MGIMFVQIGKIVTKVSLGFLLLMDIHCFTFLTRSTIPIAPLGDRSTFVLVSLPSANLPTFKTYTKQKINSVYEENNFSFVLLPRAVWEKMDRSLFLASEVTTPLGFKFFAENYQTQLKKSTFEVSDVFSGYKDQILNERYLTQISLTHSEFAEKQIIGTTQSKNPIFALRLTRKNISDNGKVNVLLHCSIHANEVITTEHCYDAIYTLITNKKLKERYLDQLIVWIIPIANPDGSDAFWNVSHLQGRKNGSVNNLKGVDLNRNFPIHWGKTGGEYSSNKIDSPYFQGPSEGSELETRALISLAEKERFVASISYHAFANALLYPYSVEGFLNPSPDLAEIVGKKLSKKTRSTHPTKTFSLKKNLYPIDGVDQDFFYFRYGTLSYVLESSHFNPEYKYVPKILDSLRNVWTQMLDEIVFGEKILIRVLNEEGAPLLTKIQIKGLSYFQGEVRTNHPKTGLFYTYYVPDLGNEMVLESDGYESIIVKTKPSSKWEIQNIIMKRSTRP
ncbi:peptidase M14 [Leptospira ognonensis]|uniref:Peptidase M14 n=2 Tax=Leptospira ognonensis TaxID=2484945 RepID=A0A4R9JVY7_9LEPT|nr:peptidase M14 [Leptospira ognonensis]